MEKSTSPLILFVDDEKHLRNSTAQAFDLADLQAECFSDPTLALSKIDRTFNGILITDIKMPVMNGLEVMKQALEIDKDFPVILVTGHADVQLAVDAMRDGAYDFIEKPFDSSYLFDVARRALEKRALTLQVRNLRKQTDQKDDLEYVLAGRTQKMIALREQIRTISQSEIDVLIQGETGTGKDVAARAIHSLSKRNERPFVAINCAAIPEDLIESELFGHEIGAFAGAVRSRYGKFEHAQRGTVFLDEIESMPLRLQVKLLQVLQDRSITRLGSNEPINLDVRILAASKTDLAIEVEEGRFRADLYYRLNVATLSLPSLKERKEDIPLLFAKFTAQASERYNKPALDIAPTLIAEISAKKWPGNVRELRHAAERFALGLEMEETKTGHDKPEASLADRMAGLEKRVISDELALNKGKLKATYESLQISRKSLYEKMQKYGLSRSDYIS